MHPDITEESRPDKSVALEYLKKVKGALKLAEYEVFLDSLTRFKASQIGAEALVTTVLPMLQGRDDLLIGFSAFLPRSCRQSLVNRYMKCGSSAARKETLSPAPCGEGAGCAGCGTVETSTNTNQPKDEEVHDSQPTKQTRAKRSLTTFDRHEWVGEMPGVEVKRRREDLGERQLRPGATPVRADTASWRQSNQQHVYRAKLKEEIRPKRAEESFLRVQERLQASVEEVLKEAEHWIPSVDFQDIVEGRVGQDVVEKVRRVGVLKIRKVLPKELAEDMNVRLMEDFKAHFNVDPARPETYSSEIYNEHSPKAFTFGGVQELYYTKVQFEVRQHRNMHRVKVWLNSLWKDDSNKRDESEQVKYACVPEADITYVDRWRHRLPGYVMQNGMKEHVDNGGMCRWADDAWREVYKDIMEGDLDRYDPWVIGARTQTSGSFFRTFQGWLALTPQGPGDGTLEVVPLLTEAMAYLLLRPFANDVPGHLFCGVSELSGDEMLEITQRWHAALLQAKVPVGSVDPGDTVWWHPDIIHGVESEHRGKNASNVIYVGAAPMCVQNARYLAKQRDSILSCKAPPDFPQSPLVEQGSERVAGIDALSELGRMQLGFAPWSDSILKDESDGKCYQRKLRVMQECNRMLFPDGAQHDWTVKREVKSREVKEEHVAKGRDGKPSRSERSKEHHKGMFKERSGFEDCDAQGSHECAAQEATRKKAKQGSVNTREKMSEEGTPRKKMSRSAEHKQVRSSPGCQWIVPKGAKNQGAPKGSCQIKIQVMARHMMMFAGPVTANAEFRGIDAALGFLRRALYSALALRKGWKNVTEDVMECYMPGNCTEKARYLAGVLKNNFTSVKDRFLCRLEEVLTGRDHERLVRLVLPEALEAHEHCIWKHLSMAKIYSEKGVTQEAAASRGFADRLKLFFMTGAWMWANPELGDNLKTLQLTGVLEHVVREMPLELKVPTRSTPIAVGHIGTRLAPQTGCCTDEGPSHRNHSWRGRGNGKKASGKWLPFYLDPKSLRAWEEHLQVPIEDRHSSKGFGPFFYLMHATMLLSQSSTKCIKKGNNTEVINQTCQMVQRPGSREKEQMFEYYAMNKDMKQQDTPDRLLSPWSTPGYMALVEYLIALIGFSGIQTTDMKDAGVMERIAFQSFQGWEVYMAGEEHQIWPELPERTEELFSAMTWLKQVVENEWDMDKIAPPSLLCRSKAED